MSRARLHIAVDNRPSQHVARATGFFELALPLVKRRRKGQVLHLAVWERTLQLASPAGAMTTTRSSRGGGGELAGEQVGLGQDFEVVRVPDDT